MAKKLTKQINAQFSPSYMGNIPMYGFGSWLKSNAGGLLQTAGGAALTATGIGTAAGIGMMASGLGSLVSTGDPIAKQQAQLADQQKQAELQQLLGSLEQQQQYSFGNGGQVDKSKTVKNKDYINNWDKFHDVQGAYTKALATKYPNIPIPQILDSYSKDSTFSNKNLNKYSSDLINQYGDFHLTPQEMDSISGEIGTDVRGIQKMLSSYDQPMFNDTAKTVGTKEESNLRFGPRMMLQKRYVKGQVPYKFLEEKGNGGVITDRITSVDNGGLHSENGGVKIGQNAMVERDEVIFKTKAGKKYVFSNKF